ncbi:hypothetical protein AGMMS49965_20760 [Bacteroidia bacterium]|nr:hypothetical protein AGMMS49965_20760 [Bacteroidia bacterium]
MIEKKMNKKERLNKKFTMKKTIFIILLLLPIFLSAQKQMPQTVDAATQQQLIEQSIRIGMLEKQLEELKTANVSHYSEMEARFEVKKENLENEKSRSNNLLVIIGILATIIGFVIPVIIFLFGLSWIKKAEKEFQDWKREANEEFVEKINDFEKQFLEEKNKIETIREEAKICIKHIKDNEEQSTEITTRLQALINTEPSETRKADNIENAKNILNDPNATEFEKDWADALIDCFSNKNTVAIDKFNKLLKKYSNKINYNDLSRIYAFLSWCYASVEDVDKAKIYAESAIFLNPNNPRAWHNKGFLLEKLNKKEEALQCYDNSIEINPDNWGAWNNKGTLFSKLDRDDEALKCYDKSIAINPDDDSVWYNKGLLFSKLDRDDEALKCYDKAIEINPDDDGAWNNKGVLLEKLNKEEEALQCYNKAIEINPNNDEAKANKERLG